MAATVSFRLNNRKKTDKPVSVMVSYFHRGLQIKDLSTGERCRISEWTGSRLSRNAPRAAKVNKVLSDLENTLLNIPYDHPGISREVEAGIVRSVVRGEETPIAADEKKSIVQLWSEFLESIKDTVEHRTFRGYSNSFRTAPLKNGKEREAHNFMSFLKLKRLESITPDEFTITHYNLYHGYLKKNLKPNTVAKKLKHLKQFFTHITSGFKVSIGFDIEKITYKQTSGLKISLSEEELQAYITADLSPGLQKIRDLAVLQCSTGLRISDRKRIDRNIRADKIVIEAQKTRSRMEILITPQIREILQRYNYNLPVISEQKYREGIKEIHKKLFPNKTIQVREGNGYVDVYEWEEISSHDMVRTFITLSAERGMPISAIAKITGKSVSTLLKNYLVESQITANREMEKAWAQPLMKVAN